MSAKKKPGKARLKPRKSAEAHFTEGLIIRGEAVPPSDDKPLPPGATHELTGEGKVKRRRFKLL